MVQKIPQDSTQDVPVKKDICAIVTTYNPDEEFPVRIARTQSQVQHIVIVDDGATTINISRLVGWFSNCPDIHLIHHELNKGVAAALNTGMNWAIENGFTHALLLDDDSLICLETVNVMLASYKYIHGSPLTILGTNYGISKIFSREDNPGRSVGVSSVITAGTLIPLQVFDLVGPFREDFFIDYVDHEYCLRARAHGVTIHKCLDANMDQPIGQTLKVAYGELSSIHSPIRTYYFFRNSFAVIQEYIWKYPRFSAWIVWQQVKTIVKILGFLRPKRHYWNALTRGLQDGYCKRFGRIPEEILR